MFTFFDNMHAFNDIYYLILEIQSRMYLLINLILFLHSKMVYWSDMFEILISWFICEINLTNTMVYDVMTNLNLHVLISVPISILFKQIKTLNTLTFEDSFMATPNIQPNLSMRWFIIVYIMC